MTLTTLSTLVTPTSPVTVNSVYFLHPVVAQSTNHFENYLCIKFENSPFSSTIRFSWNVFEGHDQSESKIPRDFYTFVIRSPSSMDSVLLDDDGSHDDLLVFGYGCKIFRDDTRARNLDDKTHLIPWMGDPNNLIDRYDCRGALTDVSKYEPGSSFIHEIDVEDDELSDTAIVTEKELDEERYRDLNEDEDFDERAFDRELDYQKFQSDVDGVFSNSLGQKGGMEYAAYQYNYDEQKHEVCIGPEPERLHDDDSPFVKPVGLYIPEEIPLPETMKLHAIIEKTARFIASQGSQMEILLKTKQANNPLFKFLNHDGLLNPYYKFLVHSIRAGIYRPVELDSGIDHGLEDDAFQVSSQSSVGEEDASHTYLHPSLLGASGSGSSVPSKFSLDSTVAYTAAAGSSTNRHNAYSMLVSKIKGTDSPDPSQQIPMPYPMPTDYHPVGSSTNTNVTITTNPSTFGYSIPGHGADPRLNHLGNPVRPKKQLPSSQDQLVIEKMASYVIKNGANFEAVAKSKGDPRFSFLDPGHEFHWYYLNCKERFKAECNAVVASSDFVNYSGQNTMSSNARNVNSATTTVSVKKSAVAAELAEMKKKSIAMLAKKEIAKNTGAASSNLVENVFSRAKLVGTKEKDKPVIRFATSLSISGSQAPTQPKNDSVLSVDNKQQANADESKKEAVPRPQEVEQIKRMSYEEIDRNEQIAFHEEIRRLITKDTVDEKEEGEIDSEQDPGQHSDSDPFDEYNLKGGNSSPASEDDDEKVRRRMERKRKAALFLQKLKMSKISHSVPVKTDADDATTLTPTTRAPVPLPLGPVGTSLGDLLSHRMKMSETDTTNEPTSTLFPTTYINPAYYDNGVVLTSRSSSSSPYTRSRSRSYTRSPPRRSRKKKKKRSRSRSYSSSVSITSEKSSRDSSGRSSHSKKKSKKKHRKKKKKQEKQKSSRRSSKKTKKR